MIIVVPALLMVSTIRFRSFKNVDLQSRRSAPILVLFALIVAAVAWYLLEHTATGRRLYATGFNPDAARLAWTARRSLIWSTVTRTACRST